MLTRVKAKQIPSPFFNLRPKGEDINLLVVHCISLPEGNYAGEQVQELFCGRLDCTQHESFASLQGLEVSAHFFIRRDGELIQFVDLDKRAWHAGLSEFSGKENCNDYSIGVELEGTDKSAFTEAQYLCLAKLSKEIMSHYPMITLERIVGHSDIAPGRKSDPGIGFDWCYFRKLLTHQLV